MADAILRIVGGAPTDEFPDCCVIGLRRSPNEDLNDVEARFGFESDLEFVAGGSGFDSCRGDSGGPAYITTAAGVLKVAGVTFRAVSRSSHLYGEGGICSRVDVHDAFIHEVAASVGIQL